MQFLHAPKKGGNSSIMPFFTFAARKKDGESPPNPTPHPHPNPPPPDAIRAPGIAKKLQAGSYRPAELQSVKFNVKESIGK